jgi:hypothetical protein
MAEITRLGPLARARPIDSASVVTSLHAVQIFGDLAAAAIKREGLHDASCGAGAHIHAQAASCEELPDDTRRKQLTEAVEKTYRS